MRSVGIRELRQQASAVLRDVERGETVEVTDRGRPVARIAPVSGADRFEHLVASGRIRPAVGDVLELPSPLEPVEGVPLPSEELAAMRKDER